MCPGLTLGYRNPTKVTRSNQQKHTFTTGSVGTFLLIAACHLSWVSIVRAQFNLYVTVQTLLLAVVTIYQRNHSLNPVIIKASADTPKYGHLPF